MARAFRLFKFLQLAGQCAPLGLQLVTAYREGSNTLPQLAYFVLTGTKVAFMFRQERIPGQQQLFEFVALGGQGAQIGLQLVPDHGDGGHALAQCLYFLKMGAQRILGAYRPSARRGYPGIDRCPGG